MSTHRRKFPTLQKAIEITWVPSLGMDELLQIVWGCGRSKTGSKSGGLCIRC